MCACVRSFAIRRVGDISACLADPFAMVQKDRGIGEGCVHRTREGASGRLHRPGRTLSGPSNQRQPRRGDHVMSKLKPETRDKLKTVSTATLCTALYKRGLRNQFIQDVHPLNPNAGNMVGEAFTLRYIPAREDLNQ